MKNIGIMTMHRIRNYGSFMQSYCLMNLVKNNGSKVQFVDYVEEKSIINKKNSLINKIFIYRNPINFIREKIYNKKFNSSYDFYIKKYLNVKKEKNFHPKIDELIIGSDEVFNCFQGSPVGYSKELFGYNYNIPKITYAACFGNTKIDDINKYHLNKELGDMLSEFKMISTRDKNSYEIVKKLTGYRPIINIDPVLTFDCKKYLNKKKLVSKHYILIYAYTRRLTAEEEKQIKKYAKKNNLDIVSIGGFQKIAKYNLILDPFDIFNYFKNAFIVITDTFHGTIFSIITHANFYSIIRESNKNKLYDLLKRLELKNRILDNIYEIDEYQKEKISFNKTDEIIKKEIKNTIKYLNNNL